MSFQTVQNKKREAFSSETKRKNKAPIQLSDHFSYRLLLRFVFPSIVMMIFTSIYGVVDGFFVSNFVGKTPFAALNLIMPFLMILGGVGFMFGTGGSALVAKLLGEGKKELANRYFSIMVEATILVGIILTVLGLTFTKPISLMLGATPEMFSHCVLYGRVTILFTVAFMLQNVFQSFLVAAENPGLGLTATVAAGITNMVLDAVFIAVFKWGLTGAALATGFGQVVGAVIPLVYFIKNKQAVLHIVKTPMEIKPVLRASSNGVSEFVNNISSSFIGILFNLQLLKFAGENGIAAYGVLMYVQFIFIAVFIGFSMGSAPIISFHYGAGNHGELQNMLKKSAVFTFTCGILMSLLAFLLSGVISDIFVGYDEELFALTKHAFRLISVSFLFIGFNVFSSSFFTALNNGLISAVVSFLRTLVFQTLCVLILPVFFQIDGVWFSMVIAEVLSFLVSTIFLFANRRKYHYM